MTLAKRQHLTGKRTRSCRGLTLIEMVVSLAVTGIICTAIGAMFFSIAHATDSSKDMYLLVTKNRSLMNRLGAHIRSSAMILDQGTGYLILWSGDYDADGKPSLLELERIERDSTTNNLSYYKAPAGTADVIYELTEDFTVTTDALITEGTLVAETWASDVERWDVDVDHVDPQLAKRIDMQIDLRAGNMLDTTILTVSLRN